MRDRASVGFRREGSVWRSGRGRPRAAQPGPNRGRTGRKKHTTTSRERPATRAAARTCTNTRPLRGHRLAHPGTSAQLGANARKSIFFSPTHRGMRGKKSLLTMSAGGGAQKSPGNCKQNRGVSQSEHGFPSAHAHRLRARRGATYRDVHLPERSG